MPQKSKTIIGLVVIGILAVTAVLAFYWSSNRLQASADSLVLTMSPDSAMLTPGQTTELKVSGGSLPYGGYLSDDSSIAVIDSWFSSSVANGTTDPALTLWVRGIAVGQTTIRVWDARGAIATFSIVVDSGANQNSDSLSVINDFISASSEYSLNTKAKFVPSSITLDEGSQKDVTVNLGGTSSQWSGIINNNPSVASTVWFGATQEGANVNLTMRIIGLSAGITEISLLHKDGTKINLVVTVEKSTVSTNQLTFNK